MCGIVGYVGPKNALGLLIEGLKRLEYRGYDSAGVAVFDRATGQAAEVKAEGKIARLEKKCGGMRGEYRCGIGHTRWATHGAPTETNAHPHVSADGRIMLIHNGIIENHDHLRSLLAAEGCTFRSETDTEVLAHLVAKYYTPGNLLSAVSSALRLVEGTYGLAVISADEPGLIIGARKGSPLIIGVGDGEMHLASDIAALVAHTQRVIYLEEGELVTLSADDYHIYNPENIEISKEVEKIQGEIEAAEKAGFPHFMLKEIHEQPTTVANCFRGRLIPDIGAVKLGGLSVLDDRWREFKKITITACGTSWHAALVGEYLFEDLAGIPVEVEYASEFRYRNPVIGPETLVIVISQSGETADTLAALREAKLRGCTVVSVCNVIASTIAREADCGMYIHAGLEIGVASTKAFTSQVTALFLLALKLGRADKLSGTQGMELIRALLEVPAKVEAVLARSDEIKRIALEYAQKRNALFLGRGIQFPVALEGALKLKEISYIHAEGYPAAEMKHGPIALIDEDMPVVVLALKYGVYDKILSNIQQVKARNGRVIAIATEGDTEIARLADHVIEIPAVPEPLSPIVSVVPLQLLSYHIAVARGCHVDQPRNLAKSVTVE